MRSLTIIAALPAAALALTACGGTADNAAPTKTVTVAPPSATAPASTPTVPPSSAKPPAAKKIRVPNVVGKNHQAAQDLMQAAGLWMLREEDATDRTDAHPGPQLAGGPPEPEGRDERRAGGHDHPVLQEDRGVGPRSPARQPLAGGRHSTGRTYSTS